MAWSTRRAPEGFAARLLHSRRPRSSTIEPMVIDPFPDDVGGRGVTALLRERDRILNVA
jgi:hypothetical protein